MDDDEKEEEHYVDHSLERVTMEELGFLIDMLEGRYREGTSLEPQPPQYKTTQPYISPRSSTRTTRDHAQTANHCDVYNRDILETKTNIGNYCPAKANQIEFVEDCQEEEEEEQQQQQQQQSTEECCICHSTEDVCPRFGIPICKICSGFIELAAQNDFFYMCTNSEDKYKCDLIYKLSIKSTCKGCWLRKILSTPGFDHMFWNQQRSLTARRKALAHDSPPSQGDRLGNQSCGICESACRIVYRYGLQICWKCFQSLKGVCPTDIPIPCDDGRFKCTLSPGPERGCRGCRLNKAFLLGLQYSTLKDAFMSRNTKSKLQKSCDICDNTRLVQMSNGVRYCTNCYEFLKYAERKCEPYQCETGQFRCNLNVSLAMCRGCRMQSALKLGLLSSRFRAVYIANERSTTSTNADSRTQQAPIIASREHKATDYSQAKKEQRLEAACGICGNLHSIRKIQGIRCCTNCLKFIKIAELRNGPYFCSSGQFNCSIVHKRGLLCQYCRMKKALELGLQNSKLRTLYSTMPQMLQDNTTNIKLKLEPIDSTSERADSLAENCDNSSRSPCAVCGNCKKPYRTDGIITCINCRRFLRNATQKDCQYQCSNGQFNCIIVHKRGLLCQYCRVMKALKRGLQNPRLQDFYQQNY